MGRTLGNVWKYMNVDLVDIHRLRVMTCQTREVRHLLHKTFPLGVVVGGALVKCGAIFELLHGGSQHTNQPSTSASTGITAVHLGSAACLRVTGERLLCRGSLARLRLLQKRKRSEGSALHTFAWPLFWIAYHQARHDSLSLSLSWDEMSLFRRVEERRVSCALGSKINISLSILVQNEG